MPVVNDPVIDDAPDDDFTEDTDSRKPVAEGEASKALVELLADPQIAEIVAARRAGRGVNIVDVESAEAVPDEVPVMAENELEDLDPEMRKVVQLLTTHMTNSINPLKEKVTALESLASTMQQTAVTDQIAEVEKKHKDFGKYRAEMAALARAEGSGLGIEELYLITKARAGDLNVTDPSTDSEKPTPTPRRKGIGPRRDNNNNNAQTLSSGRAFKMTLADALDRTIGQR